MSEPGYYWQGDKVRLRSWEPSDWQHDRIWLRDSEGARRSGWISFPAGDVALQKRVEETALRQPGRQDDIFNLVIETPAGEAVGVINTDNCDRLNGTFSYGLYVAVDARRNGYAAEAVLLVLRYLFLERRYQKADITVYAFNEPSIRLHERLGFQLEGRLRRRIYSDGAFHDELRFGMTIEEFREKHQDWLSRRATQPAEP